MRTDELRRALDDLSGDEPAIDDALRGVASRARMQRWRARGIVVAVCTVVIAGTTIGAVQLRSNGRHVSVVNPAPELPAGNVADLTWTRVPAPAGTINRIVTAAGRSFALGSSPDGHASIGQLDADGRMTALDPAANYDVPIRSGTVNDLVAIPGALIAVGESVGAGGVPFPDAWRSTDGGTTWNSVQVEVSRESGHPTMRRVVFSQGDVYAVGTADDATPDLHCPIAVWKSSDGTDFHLVPGHIMCAGAVDATDGPAGLVVTTSVNASAWHRTGNEWGARSVSDVGQSTVNAIASDDHGYVAVGSTANVGYSISSGAIWWSPDGRKWTRVATAPAPELRGARAATFTGVAHTRAGWIAVGFHSHFLPGKNVNDAVVWTSSDGEHWTQDKRDLGTFEQFAQADGAGATSDGFAIFGRQVKGLDINGDPLGVDHVLWLGTSTPADAPLGIIEGTMVETGGPKPLYRPVAGTAKITAADGHVIDVEVDSRGWYSTTAQPGTYSAVGHSPAYGNGAYDCESWLVGSDMGGDPIIVKANTVTHIDFRCSVR